jgi:hypothetical protein
MPFFISQDDLARYFTLNTLTFSFMWEIPIAYAYALIFIHYCMCFAFQIEYTFKILFSVVFIITNIPLVFIKLFLKKSICICNCNWILFISIKFPLILFLHIDIANIICTTQCNWINTILLSWVCVTFSNYPTLLLVLVAVQSSINPQALEGLWFCRVKRTRPISLEFHIVFFLGFLISIANNSDRATKW